jgi:hypothetical protein
MGNNKDEMKWRGFLNLGNEPRINDMLQGEEMDGSLYDPEWVLHRAIRLAEYGTVSLSYSEVFGYRVILHIQRDEQWGLSGYRLTACHELLNVAMAKVFLAYENGLYAEILREMHDESDESHLD